MRPCLEAVAGKYYKAGQSSLHFLFELKLLSQGKRKRARLASMQYLNGTDVGNSSGSAALYAYIWQLRGSDCTIKMGIGGPFPNVAVACNASLADSKVDRY
jgi:hypothetical protein